MGLIHFIPSSLPLLLDEVLLYPVTIVLLTELPVIAPLSEMWGRNPLYHGCNVLFIIFNIACAVSSNLNMLIGFRFLAGCAGSSPLALGGGTIADVTNREQRGTAMAAWIMGPCVLPSTG